MLKLLRRNIIENFKNFGGWTTNRKIIVFESDDWGSLRLIDREHRNKLIQNDLLKDNQNSMAFWDGIENSEDLELLYEVLNKYHDVTGKPSVITPFVNTGNPDYEKIMKDNFKNYHVEKFTDTLKKFAHGDVLNLYKEGIKKGLFQPQFHGREHLNTPIWMDLLRNNKYSKIRKGCQLYFSSYSSNDTPDFLSGFRQSLFARNYHDLDENLKNLEDGINIFETFFNRSPSVFDPPNAVSHRKYDEYLANKGINSIVTPFYRKEPDFNGGINEKKYYFGQSNGIGQIYHIRNCRFEPFLGQNHKDSYRMIKTALRWGKPAVISTHRVNYVGSIDKAFRDKNLRELDYLLKEIATNFPDVEFMSSGELSQYIHDTKN